MKRTFITLCLQPKNVAAVIAATLLSLSSPLLADSRTDALQQGAAALDGREQRRQQERERALQQQNVPQTDTRLARPDVSLPDYPAYELPCFPLNQITLVGDSADRFQWALTAAAGAKGRCLGGQGIALAINKVQNAILANSKAGQIGLSAQEVTIADARARTQGLDLASTREGNTGSTFSGQQGVTVIGREGGLQANRTTTAMKPNSRTSARAAVSPSAR